MCARYKADDEPAFPAEESPLPAPEPSPQRRKRSYWEVPEDDVKRATAAGGAEHNPWTDVCKPPPRGIGLFRGLWILVGFPFRMVFFMFRNLPTMVKWPVGILVSLCFVGLLLLFVLACIYTVKADRYDITQVLRMPERSIVLDRTGAEIGTLHGENRRSIESLDEVPQYFIDAIVLQEDRSFWEHGGVDPRGVMRALGQVVKHGRTTQGASTITMQLAKNTYGHNERDFDSKLTEVVLARRIESTYDKETILKCYINRVFWGHTYLGLKQAAYGYFCKEPKELTIGEAAMLAGIVCNPNEFSPFRNPEAARIQRDKVLKLLKDHGKITHLDYTTAMAEKIEPRRPVAMGHDNYSLDRIRTEVDYILTHLDEEGVLVKDEILYSGGLVVRTTLDLRLQDDVMHDMDAQLTASLESLPDFDAKHETRAEYQAMVAAKRAQNPEDIIPAPKYLQAACVIIDNSTGAILALVGGRDSSESPLNRALQSSRQVGSVFKPLVYSTFFEKGYGPNTTVSDARIAPGEIAGAKRWSPRNADGRYLGNKEVSWGLLKSRNTMSVRVGNMAGLSNVVKMAQRAGFPDPPKWLGPTMYLGTWEASPLEVATAYTAYANGGVRPTPYIIESITDSSGRVIWQNTPSVTKVMSAATAKTTSDILQKITKKGGTAANVEKLGFTKPCGGKTGTTNQYQNAWFCGFTSDLTAAVWVGFDTPATIKDKAYGGTVALPLWVGAMKCAQDRGYAMGNIRTSPAAARVHGLRLCRESGMLAHAGCEEKHTAYTETMADFSVERQLCSHHSLYNAEDDEYAEVVEDALPAGGGMSEEPEYAPLFADDDDAEVVP